MTTNAALDALGQRIAVKAANASFFGWLLPDLHGNVAAALGQDGANVTDGLRYDGYGQLAAIYPSGGTGVSAKWRYQGRLLVSTSGNADLYDFSARSYSPGLGAFTQLDSVMGAAANPLSMNRYLYAEANPATLIDPTGHGAKLGGCGQDCYPGAGTTVVTDPGPSSTTTGTTDNCPSSICNPHALDTVTTTSTAPDYVCDVVCYEQAQRLDFLAALNEPLGLISPMNQQTALVARIAEYALLSGDFEGANQMMQDLILMDVIAVEIAVTVVTAIPTEGLSVPAIGTVISGTAQRLRSARERLTSMLQGLPQRLATIGQRLVADERGEIGLGGSRRMQLAFGSEDLVLGPTAGGRLKDLSAGAGGNTWTAFDKPVEMGWRDFLLGIMKDTVRRGGTIRFDLTNMDDPAAIASGTHPNSTWNFGYTAFELRYIKDNWAFFKNNVVFYGGVSANPAAGVASGYEVIAPWIRP